MASMELPIVATQGSTRGSLEAALRDRAGAADAGKSTKLGTLSGVFFPSLQNILGVILFLRLPYIAGQAGILLASAVVLVCVATTFPTALSIGSIATNGKIQAGGPYYVISRSMGAPFGGSIGFLFYLGTTTAVTMYVLGAVEALQNGFGLSLGFDFDTQVIALALMVVMATLVYVGVSLVTKVSVVFLVTVLLCILAGFIGVIAFGAGARHGASGEVLPANSTSWGPDFQVDPDLPSAPIPTFGSLIALFYPSVTGIMAGANRSAVLADPSKAIPYGTLGAICTTTVLYLITIWLFGIFVDRATLIANKLVFATVAWPVQQLVQVGIVMSSVGAGLQALVGAPQLLSVMRQDEVLPFIQGCRRCCRRRCCRRRTPDAAAPAPADATAASPSNSQRALDNTPSSPVRGAATAPDSAAAGRDPEAQHATPASNSGGYGNGGDDDDDDVEADEVAHPSVAETFEDRAKKQSSGGGGGVGLADVAVTAVIAGLCCLAGNLDAITPILTEFFLLQYLTINLSCFLAYTFPSPHWRPRWQINRFISLFGVLGCLVIMLLVSWYQAIVAMVIAAGLYKWIEAEQQQDAWGQWNLALVAVQMDRARTALLSLRDTTMATPKNYRPQLVVYLKTNAAGQPSNPALLMLAGQLKKANGVVMAVSVKEGRVISSLDDAKQRIHRRQASDGAFQAGDDFRLAVANPRRTLQRHMDNAGAEGFAQIVQAADKREGMVDTLQAIGLGVFRPNTLLVGYPDGWDSSLARRQGYIYLLRSALRLRKSVIVAKGRSFAPRSDKALQIDVWWLRLDSGLVLLLPHILAHNPLWTGARLRLFAVDDSDDAEQRMEQVKAFLHRVRIDMQIEIVKVDSVVLAEAASGRTLTMASREALQAKLAGAQGKPSSLTMATGGSPVRRSVMELFGEEDRPKVEPDAVGVDAAAVGLAIDAAGATGVADEAAAAPAAPAPLGRAAVAPPAGTGHRGQKQADGDDDEEEEEEEEEETSFVKSARSLNALMRARSGRSALVVTNLALTRSVDPTEFQQYTDAVTEGLDNVLLVRGSGREIIGVRA